MKKDKEMIGVKEIARRANVSIATVDRVIHNRTGVSVKTRRKINELIQELDYQPNILASRLASRKTIHVAILLPAVSDETNFWEAPLRGIRRAEAEIKQYGVVVRPYFFDLNDKESFRQQARAILEQEVHGVLLSPSFVEESSAFIQECKQRALPYVFIDSTIPKQDNLCYIGPHLFQSGYLSAQLLTYGLPNSTDKVLVVNISREVDNFNYPQIEEGFRSFFKETNRANPIVRIDIRQTAYPSVQDELTRALHQHPDVAAWFVTNSRVASVARFLEGKGMADKFLIGYDYLPENIRYLKKGTIDFLICHKPEEQGYRGVMALYQTLVLSAGVEKEYFMPIDIITRSNYAFYRN
ncbi:substrate-binding domain-containing protein [Telluribacter sp.]|jgi:LacI family transcriptional regulator|uniref:LacI family DNA-binding transcriptional regulator n=1 Tax=Telluribacter sp. TaxID=1978767 RepID=UPI002E10560C|nr:substrate-binding domain-containing protein [Telluribacter sp.]